MNPYVLGGGVVVIAIMGFLLKGAYERTGELEAKLKTQADETTECVNANQSTTTTIRELRIKVEDMVNQRRADAAEIDRVLAERDAALMRAEIEADEMEDERDGEIALLPDCADLTSLSVDFFCPATGRQLRERSRGPGGDEDGDG